MRVFGVIASTTQIECIPYLHSMRTASQVVLIFFTFTVNEKTKKECRKMMKKKKMILSMQKKYLN